MAEEPKVVARADALLPQRLTQLCTDCGGRAALIILRSQDDLDDIVVSHGIVIPRLVGSRGAHGVSKLPVRDA